MTGSLDDFGNVVDTFIPVLEDFLTALTGGSLTGSQGDEA